jgi:hypothetical protein
MGKADFMSPKAVANRQKAKGLQKLRWYCQASSFDATRDMPSLNASLAPPDLPEAVPR